MDIYLEAKRLDKYPPLATNTEVNYFLVNTERVIYWGTKKWFNPFISAVITILSVTIPLRSDWSWIANGIRSLSSQSERAFNAIYSVSLYTT